MWFVCGKRDSCVWEKCADIVLLRLEMCEYRRNAKVGTSIGSGVKNSVLSYCSTPML